MEGLAQRDHLVFQSCQEAGLPTAVTMAGGYARNVQDTVDIHFQSVLSALEYEKLARINRKNSHKGPKMQSPPQAD
jgi:hypothetical protein